MGMGMVGLSLHKQAKRTMFDAKLEKKRKEGSGCDGKNGSEGNGNGSRRRRCVGRTGAAAQSDDLTCARRNLDLPTKGRLEGRGATDERQPTGGGSRG